MSKLNQEELLEELISMRTCLTLILNEERPENLQERMKTAGQAYQQIREMIQKPGVKEEELFDIKAREYERGLKDAQPAVDEGFVNTWANDFATATLHDKQMHKRIIYMLKEIDVEVVKK